MNKKATTASSLRSSSLETRVKLCAKCGELKPKKQFQKRLTLAQTKAFLKQPSATTRYITTSKNCMECRNKAKPKKKKPLTAKQIRTRITSGDMTPMLGEMKLQKIREGIPKMRSKNMKEAWEKRKSEPYKKLKRHLQDQLNRFGNRHFASKNLQEATRLQNSWNYEQAKLIMKDLLEQAQKGTFVPNDIQIASLIKNKPNHEGEEA